MTLIAAFLLAIVVLLILALYRQGITHLAHIDLIAARDEVARQKLMDRIQHPEIRQIQTAEWTDPIPPRDAAEMSFVGMEIPEFVHVGSDDTGG